MADETTGDEEAADEAVPAHAPDPATIEEAEDANEPTPRRRGPHIHDASDPTDPRPTRDDATGRD